MKKLVSIILSIAVLGCGWPHTVEAMSNSQNTSKNNREITLSQALASRPATHPGPSLIQLVQMQPLHHIIQFKIVHPQDQIEAFIHQAIQEMEANNYHASKNTLLAAAQLVNTHITQKAVWEKRESFARAWIHLAGLQKRSRFSIYRNPAVIWEAVHLHIGFAETFQTHGEFLSAAEAYRRAIELYISFLLKNPLADPKGEKAVQLYQTVFRFYENQHASPESTISPTALRALLALYWFRAMVHQQPWADRLGDDSVEKEGQRYQKSLPDLVQSALVIGSRDEAFAHLTTLNIYFSGMKKSAKDRKVNTGKKLADLCKKFIEQLTANSELSPSDTERLETIWEIYQTTIFKLSALNRLTSISDQLWDYMDLGLMRLSTLINKKSYRDAIALWNSLSELHAWHDTLFGYSSIRDQLLEMDQTLDTLQMKPQNENKTVETAMHLSNQHIDLREYVTKIAPLKQSIDYFWKYIVVGQLIGAGIMAALGDPMFFETLFIGAIIGGAVGHLLGETKFVEAHPWVLFVSSILHIEVRPRTVQDEQLLRKNYSQFAWPVHVGLPLAILASAVALATWTPIWLFIAMGIFILGLKGNAYLHQRFNTIRYMHAHDFIGSIFASDLPIHLQISTLIDQATREMNEGKVGPSTDTLSSATKRFISHIQEPAVWELRASLTRAYIHLAKIMSVNPTDEFRNPLVIAQIIETHIDSMAVSLTQHELPFEAASAYREAIALYISFLLKNPEADPTGELARRIYYKTLTFYQTMTPDTNFDPGALSPASGRALLALYWFGAMTRDVEKTGGIELPDDLYQLSLDYIYSFENLSIHTPEEVAIGHLTNFYDYFMGMKNSGFKKKIELGIAFCRAANHWLNRWAQEPVQPPHYVRVWKMYQAVIEKLNGLNSPQGINPALQLYFSNAFSHLEYLMKNNQFQEASVFFQHLIGLFDHNRMRSERIRQSLKHYELQLRMQRWSREPGPIEDYETLDLIRIVLNDTVDHASYYQTGRLEAISELGEADTSLLATITAEILLEMDEAASNVSAETQMAFRETIDAIFMKADLILDWERLTHSSMNEPGLYLIERTKTLRPASSRTAQAA